MDLSIRKTKLITFIWITLTIILFCGSLLVGRFPLSVSQLISGDALQTKVFFNLRLSRTLTALAGGFALGVSGFVFQMVFRNPIASPDIIGISSGASAGAAFGILFLNSTFSVILFSFTGAFISLILVIVISAGDKYRKSSTFVIAGIIVHSISQSVLMCLKTLADPEKELASIEYWIMGSLSGISANKIYPNLILSLITVLILFSLYRHIMLLTLSEEESRMLGVNVNKSRFTILAISTITVASIISLTGIISFIGLLPAHIARQINGDNSKHTMFLSGIIGSSILLISDILARSIGPTELPLSILTSFIGAPVLLAYLYTGRKSA